MMALCASPGSLSEWPAAPVESAALGSGCVMLTVDLWRRAPTRPERARSLAACERREPLPTPLTVQLRQESFPRRAYLGRVARSGKGDDVAVAAYSEYPPSTTSVCAVIILLSAHRKTIAPAISAAEQ